MIKFKDHIPNFVTIDDEPYTTEVENTKALLNDRNIRRWVTYYPNFFRFSWCHYGDGLKLLMAEFEQGKRWWVVGYISEGEVELPMWVCPKEESPVDFGSQPGF